MENNITEEVIKAMERKIEEQEREKAALEQTIASLTTQLKAKEVELSEQVKANDEELDATEGVCARVQRELSHVREAAALLSSSASVWINAKL